MHVEFLYGPIIVPVLQNLRRGTRENGNTKANMICKMKKQNC
uniref:Uncharacterized protein n=1 Tax=Arundo donax TaxID=35708 RepID=A0A0A9HP04_ARUDO